MHSLIGGFSARCPSHVGHGTRQHSFRSVISLASSPSRTAQGYSQRAYTPNWVATPGGRTGGRYGGNDYLDLSLGTSPRRSSDQELLFSRPASDYEALFQGQPSLAGNAVPYKRRAAGRERDDMDFVDEDGMEERGSREGKPSYEPRLVNGKPLLINNEISAPEVRVQGPEKETLGVMSFGEAMDMAAAKKVDVVLINGTVEPPVVRIIGWNKYKYEEEKATKQKKSQASVVETKEIRMRPRTDTNDINIKVKQALKFLKKGHKIKLSMKFEGRELQFRDQGKEVLLNFIQQVGPVAKVEGPLNFKSATYTVMLAPEQAV